MGEVHTKAWMPFVYDRLRGTVETEPGEDEIVIAAGGRLDALLDHLRGDGAVLRAEHHTDRGIATRVVVRLDGVGPPALRVDTCRISAGVDGIETSELQVLVVGEADAVHLKQVHHLGEVRLDV